MTRLAPFLLVLFVITKGHGQNYQPINSHSLQVFYQQTPYFLPNNWEQDANMWGTRIDSVNILPNADTIYYNYLTARDTAAENGNYDNVWWDAPNWNGNSTRVEQSGTCWFYNQDNDSVKVGYSLPLNHEWYAYTYSNGDSLIGKVTDVAWEDDGWIADSVKTISFTRYSNGTPTWSGITLELYKDAGFRKTVDFVKFPSDTTSIHRLDLNTINKYSPGYSLNGAIRPFPTIGDGFYHVSSCQSYGVQCYGNSGSASEQVQNVSVDTVSGQITVNVLRNTLSNSIFESSVLDLIYQPLPDTFVTIYDEIFNLDVMPRELFEGWLVPNYAFGNIYLYYAEDNCEYPMVTITSPPAECTGTEFRFAPYIGFVYHFWNVDDWYCSGWAYYYDYYTYLKVGNLTCGEQLMVGIEESAIPTFSIFPNPATDVVKLNFQGSTSDKLVVSITDILGRSMTHLELGTQNLELNVGDWPNGVYSVSVIDRKGNRHSERLVVQR